MAGQGHRRFVLPVVALVVLGVGCSLGGEDPRDAAIESCDSSLANIADGENAELGAVLDGLSPVAVGCVLEAAGTDDDALSAAAYPIVEGVLVRHPEVLVWSERPDFLAQPVAQ